MGAGTLPGDVGAATRSGRSQPPPRRSAPGRGRLRRSPTERGCAPAAAGPAGCSGCPAARRACRGDWAADAGGGWAAGWHVPAGGCRELPAFRTEPSDTASGGSRRSPAGGASSRAGPPRRDGVRRAAGRRVGHRRPGPALAAGPPDVCPAHPGRLDPTCKRVVAVGLPDGRVAARAGHPAVRRMAADRHRARCRGGDGRRPARRVAVSRRTGCIWMCTCGAPDVALRPAGVAAAGRGRHPQVRGEARQPGDGQGRHVRRSPATPG